MTYVTFVTYFEADLELVRVTSFEIIVPFVVQCNPFAFCKSSNQLYFNIIISSREPVITFSVIFKRSRCEAGTLIRTFVLFVLRTPRTSCWWKWPYPVLKFVPQEYGSLRTPYSPCLVQKIMTVLRTKIRTPIVPYSACSVLPVLRAGSYHRAPC